MSSEIDRVRDGLSGRYAIERELGAGGMARVYQAEDVRHHRKVAIKVLRPEVAAAVGPERFLREIRTSATLRHPHILPLFDSGEVADTLFYVMPLVEGESVRARLEREKQLSIEDAILIAREVADALAYAHGRGIVHRDIKPENILLENGHAVVVDFGIARVVREAGAPGLTRTGLALGTPGYMSPEQVVGDDNVDGRADLYGLACTLYELLTGQPPFTGSAERVLQQHLVATPTRIDRLRPPVPAAVASALERALAKTPADRFATTTAFAEALVVRVPAGDATRSVAVLPFLSMSADPENEYFADGITEDVIAQLSKIRSLKVVSRTSVMPFKRREQGLREIATRLQVGALVDGSVRRAGNRVRIVAQLVDASTDQHLWAETYDRDLTDIFAIQSEVALHIADALEAELSPDERGRIGRRPTTDPAVYRLYLQGRHHFIQYTRASLHASIAYFERAIASDPRYAPAHTGIAMSLTELGEMGMMSPEEAYPRARAAAARAIALDPELAEAHCTVAYIRMVYEFDWAGAEEEFQRALELSPGLADAWDLYGRLCSALERYDEAIEMLQRAQDLDPLAHRVDVATAFLRAGRNEEAADAAERAVEFDPADARAHSTVGWARLRIGRIDEGLAELEHAVELAPGNTLWYAQLGEAYAIAGRREKALEVLRSLEERSRTGYVAPYHLAYVHTGLGRYDEAVDRLEQAFAQRAGSIYGIKGAFLFRALHGHPRFRALLRRMNLA